MTMLTEKDITSEAARALRSKTGLSQKQFWAPLGVSQSVGCRYEAGMTIPKPVRILIVNTYIADGARQPAAIDGLQASERKLVKLTRAAEKAARTLADALNPSTT